jgi:arginyl-tRNA synthetase
LRKAGAPKQYDLSNLKDEKETKVLKVLASYPEVIEKTVNDLRPHYIANYLFELSNTFNQFYETVPVITAEEKVKGARIKLVESVKKIIKSGLGLLGIPTMEKM